PKNIGLPEDESERKKYFETQYIGFLNEEMCERIYVAGKKILDLTEAGDNVVFFGNTPYFVGHVFKQLEGSAQRTVIQFPFSGSPNKIRPGNFPKPEDYVTEERLAHLQGRMKKEGLWPGSDLLAPGKTTYIVDVYGSGAGPAYLMEELLRN